jgi:hypothetical protein
MKDTCTRALRDESQTPLNVEMHINDLAEFIFIKNENNAKIYLSLNGLVDSKDLFYFCLDLFCKGLVLLFGSENKVDLDVLTMDNFYSIKKKMNNASIDVILDFYQDLDGDSDGVSLNLQHIEGMDNNLLLREYDFIIRSQPNVFSIRFDMIYNE